MPIDPTKVAVAVGRGLSVVCATCEKYHRARDKGVPGDKCLSMDGCGSPIAGDTFHEYEGPMTRLDMFCFVCGARSTHAIRVKGHVRVVGCCRDHVDLVRGLKAEGASPVHITVDGERI